MVHDSLPPLTPCPHCQSNKFVEFHKFSCEHKSIKKALNGQLTQDIVIGVQCMCKAQHPSGPHGVCDTKGRTFMSYTPTIWKSQPESIRRRHSECFVDLEDTTTNLLLSPAFSDRLLFLRGNFQPFVGSMQAEHKRMAIAAATAYTDFCKDQRLSQPKECPATMAPDHRESRCNQLWPAFDEKLVLSFFVCPSRTTITRMWETLCRRVEPHLLRDLFGRLPGGFVRLDGTYETMKKTMNCPDAEAENKCLVVVMGECGHIVSYAQCEAESELVSQRLLFFLRKRMERLGGMPEVNKVIAACTDTSEGLFQ